MVNKLLADELQKLWVGTPDREPSDVNADSIESTVESRPFILIVEDSRSDVLLIREALDSAQVEAVIQVVDDGDSATKFFDAADADPSVAVPKLILLDLNLPKKRGDEVLRYLRNSAKCRGVAVMVVSTSDSPRDRATVEPLGISGYFRKPSTYVEFMRLGPIVKTLLYDDPTSQAQH